MIKYEYKLEDIPETFREFAVLVGVDVFVKFIEENPYVSYQTLPNKGDIEQRYRHRKIIEEFNGYNKKELAIKYNYKGTRQVSNILKQAGIR